MTVKRELMLDFVRGLGVDPQDVISVHMDYEGVEIHMFNRNKAGERVARDGDYDKVTFMFRAVD